MNKNLHFFLFLGLILLIFYLCRDKIEPFGNQLIVPQFEFAILSHDQDINSGYFQEKICRDDPNWKNGDKTCRDYSLSGADCFEIGNNNKTAFESCLVSCDKCPSSIKMKRRKKREPSPVEDTEEPTYSVFEQSGGEFGTAGGADYRGIINKLDDLEEKIQLMNIGLTGSVVSNRGIIEQELGDIDNEIKRITDELVNFGTCNAKDPSVITCVQPADGATVCRDNTEHPDNMEHCVFAADPSGGTQGSCALTDSSDCANALAEDDGGARCLELKCTYTPPPVGVDGRIRTLLSDLTTELDSLKTNVNEGISQAATSSGISDLNNILTDISSQLGCEGGGEVTATISLQPAASPDAFKSAMMHELQVTSDDMHVPGQEEEEAAELNEHSFTVTSNRPDILSIMTRISFEAVGGNIVEIGAGDTPIVVTSLNITNFTIPEGTGDSCITFQQHLLTIDDSLKTVQDNIDTAGADHAAAITTAGADHAAAITTAGDSYDAAVSLFTSRMNTLLDGPPTNYCPYPEPQNKACINVDDNTLHKDEDGTNTAEEHCNSYCTLDGVTQCARVDGGAPCQRDDCGPYCDEAGVDREIEGAGTCQGGEGALTGADCRWAGGTWIESVGLEELCTAGSLDSICTKGAEPRNEQETCTLDKCVNPPSDGVWSGAWCDRVSNGKRGDAAEGLRQFEYGNSISCPQGCIYIPANICNYTEAVTAEAAQEERCFGQASYVPASCGTGTDENSVPCEVISDSETTTDQVQVACPDELAACQAVDGCSNEFDTVMSVWTDVVPETATPEFVALMECVEGGTRCVSEGGDCHFVAGNTPTCDFDLNQPPICPDGCTHIEQADEVFAAPSSCEPRLLEWKTPQFYNLNWQETTLTGTAPIDKSTIDIDGQSVHICAALDGGNNMIINATDQYCPEKCKCPDGWVVRDGDAVDELAKFAGTLRCVKQ